MKKLHKIQWKYKKSSHFTKITVQWESASCQLKRQMYQEKVKVEPDFCKAKDSSNLLRDAVENQSCA